MRAPALKHMTQAQEDHIVDAMPPEKREGVRLRLRAAVDAGWMSIGIWDAWGRDADGISRPLPPDDDDIFGVPPGQVQGCQPIP